VARVPLRDAGALSSQVTFLLPPLSKLLVHAKNRHLILFFAFGMSSHGMTSIHQISVLFLAKACTAFDSFRPIYFPLFQKFIP